MLEENNRLKEENARLKTENSQQRTAIPFPEASEIINLTLVGRNSDVQQYQISITLAELFIIVAEQVLTSSDGRTDIMRAIEAKMASQVDLTPMDVDLKDMYALFDRIALRFFSLGLVDPSPGRLFLTEHGKTQYRLLVSARTF